MKPYMLDTEFLRQLNEYRHKEVFVKIISLTVDETPLEQIEGRVTGGSINVDGASTVRRTCNLTFVAKDVNINDFYWSVSNKFLLEVGLKNQINSNYPDLIWFKQGTFVITSFSSTLSHNNFTISISGKDKMCLLNGDVGGNLPSSIDFGKLETQKDVYTPIEIEDYTTYVANKYYIYNAETSSYEVAVDPYDPETEYYSYSLLSEMQGIKLKDIIKEAVHTYGKEPYHNIVINDVDDYGLELLQYRGDEAFYLLYSEMEAIYDQFVSLQEMKSILEKALGLKEGSLGSTNDPLSTTLESLSVSFVFNNAVDSLDENRSRIHLDVMSETGAMISKEYSVTEITYGAVAGYRATDLTFAGDLISSIGETLTSVLDKIKNMLGPFEYFYDLDGRFVFQAKKIYSNSSWNNLTEADDAVFARDANETSAYSYDFNSINLIQKFQNTPALNELKNDYVVWGTRTSVTGAKLPIHARYAIHTKPKFYRNFEGKIFCSDRSVFDSIKNSKKQELSQSILKGLEDYQPQYSPVGFLPTPEKLEDGSWSAGWWDIRDWADYYTILKKTTPKGTMKFYAHNGDKGRQKLTDIFPGEAQNGRGDWYVWLLEVHVTTGKVTLSHGSGPLSTSTRMCDYYESEWEDAEQTKLKHYLVKEDAGEFGAPFSGCSDNHTYLYFMHNYVNKGTNIYFFNPNFPGSDSLGDAIEDTLDAELEKLVIQREINFVDWREIIYQMAKDYYRHGTEFDFSRKVAQNNIFDGVFTESGDLAENTYRRGVDSYYPNGITGYEMFYEDVQGFWRELYNPEPIKIHHTEGGNYTIEKFYEAEPLTLKSTSAWTNATSYYTKDKDGRLDQIAAGTKYDSTITYYVMDQTLAKNIPHQVQITKKEFAKNSSRYHVQAFQQVFTEGSNKDIPPFDENQEYYIKSEYGKVEITSDEFSPNTHYIYNAGTNTYEKATTFDAKVQYYIELDENNPRYERIMLTNEEYYHKGYMQVELTKEIFDSRPVTYYTKTIENKVVNYKAVGKSDIFDARQQYYIKLDPEKTLTTVHYYIKINEYLSAAGRIYDPSLPSPYFELRKTQEYMTQEVWHDFRILSDYDCDYFLDDKQGPKNWHKNVVQAPELLNYWLDFYEGSDELAKYGIGVIGDRTKVVNDQKVTSVYFRKVPQVIFTTKESYDPLNVRTGYTYIWLTDAMRDLFTISAQGKSAEEEVTNLFNKHSQCSEAITLSIVPNYYLEPNTIINIHNDECGINGQYIVNKISLPLTYNGMMNINATKVLEQV